MSEATPELGLSEQDLDPDPFRQFARWYREAADAGLPFPEAMTLATAARDGRPSARIVLLRGFDERGFAFYTNYESRKGMDLRDNPHAALVFHWRELQRQVSITGTAAQCNRQESESYFRNRPRESQLSAWASMQSRVIPGRIALEDRFNELTREYEGKDVPLPPYWGGYRLSPNTMEFWHHRDNRLHDRLRYSRVPCGGWRIERLSP